MEKIATKTMPQQTVQKKSGQSFYLFLLCTGLSIFISFLPPFGSLSRPAMIYIGAFVWMMLMMTFSIIPHFIVPLITLLILLLARVIDFNAAFAPFSGSTLWLVIGVLGLSVAISKSGILNRLVVYLLRPFAPTFKGQVLAMFTSNLILAPFIPSIMGKLAILSPLAVNMSERNGYQKASKGAVGMFSALYVSAGIFGNAFLTGTAAAPIMIGFMKYGKTDFNFLSWLSGTWVWLSVIFIGSYIFITRYYKPQAERVEQTQTIAAEQEALPPISRNEIITLIIMAMAIFLWITEGWHGINATIIVLCALALFIIFDIMSPADFNQKIDWKTVVFIGAIFGLSHQVAPLGITDWLVSILHGVAGPFLHNPYLFVLMLCVLTFITRFFFISSTVLVALFSAVFGPLAASVGISSFIVVFIVYLVSQDWNTPFSNVAIITTLTTTQHKLADYKDTYAMNIAYFCLNVIGFLASVPMWQMAGFIQ